MMKIVVIGLREPDKRIQAVKALRSQCGIGLREAKDVIDRVALGKHVEVFTNSSPGPEFSEWILWYLPGGKPDSQIPAQIAIVAAEHVVPAIAIRKIADITGDPDMYEAASLLENTKGYGA